MYQTKSNQKEAGVIIFFSNLFISGCARSSEWCIAFLQLQSTGSRPSGLSRCHVHAGSRVMVHVLALEHAGLLLCGMWDLRSPTTDQTLTICIGRWVLNHWTIREVPRCNYFKIRKYRLQGKILSSDKEDNIIKKFNSPKRYHLKSRTGKTQRDGEHM